MVQGHGSSRTRGIPLSVHGPAGVLDLLVPGAASVADVSREYAARAGLPEAPLLHTSGGRPLPADRALVDVGVGTGAVLAAVTPAHRPPESQRQASTGRRAGSPEPLAPVWFWVAAGFALVAGWLSGGSDPSASRTTAIVLLALAALVGTVPTGRYAEPRALAAPAFGAAAALAVVWDPHPQRLPVVLGISALAGAVTAALARMLADRAEEGLRVWTVAGTAVFATTALAALLGASAAVTWSVLLVGGVLAARLVPAAVVDVPDRMLLDLDRLAVTAWSARDRPAGGRSRVVVSPTAVAEVARRGSRLVTAACVAIAGVAVVSAGLLLDTVTLAPDRTGARLLVLFAGGALLLAGRDHRHGAARAMLRMAGLGCWAWLSAVLLVGPAPAVLVGGTVVAAAVLVVVAVATGRGWRSVWWARRAEVAEGLCGAAALASVLVATGLFRAVWDLGSRVGS